MNGNRNGSRNAPKPTRPAPVGVEAWSTGLFVIDLAGASGSLRACVELLRLHSLVHIVTRCDADDATLVGFPLVVSAVEWYPVGSLHVDPLHELGCRVRDDFIKQLHQVVAQTIESKKIAEVELKRLADLSPPKELGPTEESEKLLRGEDDALALAQKAAPALP